MLDELNAGRLPECTDAETAELLAVANLIRKESGPIRPPQHILDQTVDRALAGIQASKPKHSHMWWYSGTLGTAAAVILLVGLNLLPSWQQQVLLPSVQPAMPQELEVSRPAPADQPAVTSKPLTDERPSPASTSPYKISQPSANTAPGQIAQSLASQQQISTSTAVTLPQPDSTSSVTERIPAEVAPRKSFPKSISLAITPVKLPGQVPELVVTDKEQGTLRQVYFKGTPQELTITQHLRKTGSRSESYQLAIDKTAFNKPDGINIVQTTIAGQEVTLEGRQSPKELLKLAASLTL